MKPFVVRAGLLTLAWIAYLFLNNSSSLYSPRPGSPVLLAHRGLAQDFDRGNLTSETCTASRMRGSSHPYLENTLPSMRAAFEAGADVVELDIHPTTDGQLAVFHDWSLECRTDGKGLTRAHSLAQLQALDVGYGYTADDGRTFPFRGKGIGLLPSLDEVLRTFADHRFLIHIKSNDPADGEKLADRLKRLEPVQQSRLAVYGGDQPVGALHRILPQISVMSKATMKACLGRYLVYGWTGVVPEACENTLLLLPVDWAPWLWGWPGRLVDRMKEKGTVVYAAGPYEGGGFSQGLNTLEALSWLPEEYTGGIWTDRVELIAPQIRRRRPAR